tara:strand:- start:12 stop:440 length:429 start_codon:yes stop_codon:yes gene_type:complete
MKNIILLIGTIILICCSTEQVIEERSLIIQKVEAFQFLSKYHHQLHVMIGEENGDINKAYNEFYNAVINYNNIELLPIKNAFSRIKMNELNPNADSIKRLDYLVDYYQSGLSMQIEGIFRGYGYLEILDMGNIIKLYDKIKK